MGDNSFLNMIYNTLEEAQKAQKEHYERVKAESYRTASDCDKGRLDSYYSVTTEIYKIVETKEGFVYSEDGNFPISEEETENIQ